MFAQKINLWNHQRQGIEAALAARKFGFFFETGTGKTLTAIYTLRGFARSIQRHPNTLIIAPKGLLETWRRELMQHTPEPYHAGICILMGTQPERRSMLQDPANKVFITNEATISMQFLWTEILAKPWDALIIDESHRFKNPKAQRTKALIRLCDKVYGLKLVLTGSPILNSPADVWAQDRLLGTGVFPASYWTFLNQNFYDANSSRKAYSQRYWPDWRLRPDRLEYVSTALSQIGQVVKKSEVLDLPPLVRKPIYVPLSTEQKRIYKEMERDFVATLKDDTAHVDLAITKLLRLQQICSGVLTGDSGETHTVETEKLDVLRTLLEQITPGHKVLVWTQFRPTYPLIKQVCEDIGVKSVMIVGEQKLEDRQAAVDAFQLDPKIRVCIANQAAGGTGLNLQAASYSIYYSKDFSLEKDLQSEARNYRGGSEIHKTITRIDLIAEGTVEEQVTAALSQKLEMSEMLTRLKEAA